MAASLLMAAWTYTSLHLGDGCWQAGFSQSTGYPYFVWGECQPDSALASVLIPRCSHSLLQSICFVSDSYFVPTHLKQTSPQKACTIFLLAHLSPQRKPEKKQLQGTNHSIYHKQISFKESNMLIHSTADTAKRSS